jgi:hypothetical protein
MGTKTKSRDTASLIGLAILIIIDILTFILGNSLQVFDILQTTEEGLYIINYSGLALFLAFVGYNVLTIYHIVVKNAIYSIVNFFDTNGTVRKGIQEVEDNASKNVNTVTEGLKKIEAHLINYDPDSIEFSYLSAIETEVGANKKEVHNEIWVLTNDFEECNESDEAIELRKAILNNLKNNVDYYYVIPKDSLTEMEELINKLTKDLDETSVTGSFNYIPDDALDFIPAPYFDIVMYFRLGMTDGFRDKSSEVYYCFSRKEMQKEEARYFYRKVNEDAVMRKLKDKTLKYKIDNKRKFVTPIKPVKK